MYCLAQIEAAARALSLDPAILLAVLDPVKPHRLDDLISELRDGFAFRSQATGLDSSWFVAGMPHVAVIGAETPATLRPIHVPAWAGISRRVAPGRRSDSPPTCTPG
jgi:hypothetical protein